MTNVFGSLLLIFATIQNPIAPPQTPATPQPVAPQTPASPVTTPSALMATESSQLGPGDVINVEVWTGNELQAGSLTLAADGTVLVPFGVNKILKVSGLTSLEVRSLIDTELRRSYLNPVVQVIQSSLQSKRALMVTDNGRSGYFPITGETNVLEFIIANGGYNTGANLAEVRITRIVGDMTQQIPVNLFNVLMGTDTSGNIRLLPGDQIYVPSLGSVSTKIFMYLQGRSITLLQVPEKITLLDALSRTAVVSRDRVWMPSISFATVPRNKQQR